MPKKTKKEKIEARRHRLLKKNEVTYDISEKIVTRQPTPATVHISEPTPKKQIFEVQDQNTTYFRNDLLKTLMITMIIICIQAAIYVAQLTGSIDITNLITF